LRHNVLKLNFFSFRPTNKNMNTEDDFTQRKGLTIENNNLISNQRFWIQFKLRALHYPKVKVWSIFKPRYLPLLRLAEFETKQIVNGVSGSNKIPINYYLQICTFYKIHENVARLVFVSSHQANSTPIINPKSALTKFIFQLQTASTICKLYEKSYIQKYLVINDKYNCKNDTI
jgi:hypothetical protein